MKDGLFSQIERERLEAELEYFKERSACVAYDRAKELGMVKGLQTENGLLREKLRDYDRMKSDYEKLEKKHKDADEMAERLAAELAEANKKYQTMKREYIDLLRNMGLHIDPVGEKGACGCPPEGDPGPECLVGIPFPGVELCQGGETADGRDKSQSI